MNDWKRVSGLAIVLVVLLRIAIGWQFLYEGIWKYDSLKSPNPWTAEGYLKAAQGPFRDHFRGMTGDPDDLGWLDYDAMSARWDGWQNRFSRHYGFTAEQQAELAQLLDGPPVHQARLEALPDGVDLDKFVREKLKGGPKLTFDAGRKVLLLESSTPLTAAEAADLKALDPNPDGEFAKAITTLERAGSKLSYRQRLAAELRGDPETVGVVARADKATPERYVPEMGTAVGADPSTVLLKYGEIQVYKDMLANYAQELKKASQDSIDFRQQHLETLWGKIQAKRNELVGPIKALDKSLKEDAIKLLTPQQLAKGAPPAENTPLKRASDRAMWGLLILGLLLIAGLLTPFAALAGAVMLLSFYLVTPPFPGVPQPPGPEHSLFVNKNLIEVLALLGIAALPTGRWFGLDGLLLRIFRRKKAA